MNLTEITLKETKEGLKKGKFSLQDVVTAFKNRIKEKNKEINAVISVVSDFRENKNLPLYGAVFVVKDNILVKNEKCTAGSKMLEHYIAPFDATVISKIKDAGGVIIGKGNMDEFAMGSSTESSAFGATKNPLSLSKVPGGSSGGPAAALASNMCNTAIGSDTGGSIRQPAAFCGVVGMKPTYGTVSRNGLISMSSSLDQIGPLTKTVEDAETIFNVIKGKDKYDSTTVDIHKKGKDKLRIGIPKEYFVDGLDDRIKKTIDKAIEKITVNLEEISLPYTEYALPAYYIIMPSEISSNLARFDGMRYGLEKGRPASDSILDAYLKNRGDSFGREVKRRIALGTFSLSSGYHDAYYLQAQKVRSLIFEDFQKAFKKVDLILTPTTPNLPFNIGEKIDNPVSMYLSDIFTVTANLAGLPAISLPCGEIDGFSVGAQLIAPRFCEEDLFNGAKMLEKIWWK